MSWFDVDSAFAEMEALSRQMDALVGQRGLDGRHGLRLFAGAAENANFADEGEDLVWRGDLPGYAKEDVEITVENGILSLNAHRPQPAPVDGKSLRLRERRAGDLTRSWSLPDTVDPASVGASLEDGVLVLRLKKRPETKPRQITVR